MVEISRDLAFELMGANDHEVVEYEGKNYNIKQSTDWNDDGKYDFADIVFELDGETYSFWASRSGSYYTDWEYDFAKEAVAVKPVEKVITVWESV